MKSTIFCIVVLWISASLGVQAQNNSKIRDIKITLNNDNKYTTTPTVPLNVRATRAKKMLIANDDETFRGAEWMDYSMETMAWKLREEDGEHAVYVKLKDEDGHETEIFIRTVILDRKAPQSAYLKIQPSAEFAKKNPNMVDLEISVVEATFMKISNHENLTGIKWESYRPKVKNWLLEGKEDGLKKVYARFRDQAGNETEPVSDQIEIDTKPPVRASIVINNAAEYTNDPSRTVKLRLSAVGATRMLIANDAQLADSQWFPYGEELSWTLEAGDGVKRVYVKFADDVGNESTVASDQILYDGTPPQDCVIMINKGASSTNDRDNTVSLQMTAREADFMMLSNSADFSRGRWQPFAKEVAKWKLGQGTGTKTVYVKFKDRYENETGIFQASIIVESGK
jgi:hypothetical protein